MALDLPSAIYATRWLIRDTFRQARASGLSYITLGVSALCILLCLSVQVTGTRPIQSPDDRPEFLPKGDPKAKDPEFARRHGVDVADWELSLAFGAMHVAWGRPGETAAQYLQARLAGVVADAAGILLTLIWTAGFLPSFLDPSAAAVLLAKPIPRWSLLIGKYLGVLAFVFFQAVVFVFGTWAALGLRIGEWPAAYLLCIPLLLLHFAVFFSFSTFIAVCTRSTVACVLGSILFWLICWGMNFGRHSVLAHPDLQTLGGGFSFLVEAGYWTLPKPADLLMVLFDALQAGAHMPMAQEFKAVQEQGAFHPELSILASVIFAVAMLAVAARQFVTTDY